MLSLVFALASLEAHGGTLADLTCSNSPGSSLPAAAPTAWPGQRLYKKTIDTTTFPNAVCNDESPGVYYVRQGLGADTSKWLIHLQGGFSCADYQTCEDRWCSSGRNLMSSDFEAEEIHLGGLFDRYPSIASGSVGNGFAQWNVVVVKYCSQDVHTGSKVGTVTDGVDSLTIPFRGRAILAATIKELQAGNVEPDVRVDVDGDGFWDEMPDIDLASHVVLTGTSAGGGGVTQLADKVRRYLRNSNPSVTFHAVVDAATVPDPYSMPATNDVDVVRQAKYDTRTDAWDAFFDYSCLQTHAVDPKQCTDPVNAMRDMGSPLFIRADAADETLYNAIMAAFAPSPYDEEDFADGVGDRLQDLADTHVASGGEVTRVFAPLCGNHGALGNSNRTYDQWLDDGATTLNAHDALWDWVNGSPANALIDTWAGQTAIANGSADCSAP